MKTITLENGRKVSISEEEYEKLVERKPTFEEILEAHLNSSDGLSSVPIFFSKKYTNKLSAIFNMILVADYLNGDWDAEKSEKWFELFYHNEDKKIEINSLIFAKTSFVRFKDKETAELALEILGEETIKTALL
jgi:hypothetical protein